MTSRSKLLPDREYLEECFNYDQDTGVLVWKERPLHHFKDEKAMKTFNRRYSGKEAGFNETIELYRKIKINNLKYMAHRIIYKIMTGEDPPVWR